MDLCNRCNKSAWLCFCSEISPQKTRTHVLILQHPQEPDKDLGSAQISHLSLANSTLHVGLSWPNLKTAIAGKKGDDTPANLRNLPPSLPPSQWGVLYLGSGPKKGMPKTVSPLIELSKKGDALEKPSSTIQGLIVLDGTWSQAKALWWRNPWLLKVRRFVLNPKAPSLYGNLRKEPRREGLSTLESIALTIEALEPGSSAPAELRKNFSRLLEKYRRTKA